MVIRHLHATGYRRERWKNGLGWTREIARGQVLGGVFVESIDEPGQPDWDWRLSIAQIDEDGPFSTFEGIDRTLVLLEGHGMTLTFDDGEVVALAAPGKTIDFAGERSLRCTLTDGPTFDFNVMWRRDRLTAAIERQAVMQPMRIDSGTTEQVVLHVFAGTMRIVADGRFVHAGPSDTILLQAGSAATLEPGGSVDLLIIRFEASGMR